MVNGLHGLNRNQAWLCQLLLLLNNLLSGLTAFDSRRARLVLRPERLHFRTRDSEPLLEHPTPAQMDHEFGGIDTENEREGGGTFCRSTPRKHMKINGGADGIRTR